MLMRNRRTFHASRLASLAMETRVRLLSWKLPRAVDAPGADEGLVQPLALHGLDGIAPELRHAHGHESGRRRWGGGGRQAQGRVVVEDLELQPLPLRSRVEAQLLG